MVLFGRHSDPNELRQRPEKGNEQITEKITLHITQLWGCYDDEGEKIFRGTMMGVRDLFFLKKESESDLTISLQLSDWEQTEKEKRKKGIKAQEKEEGKDLRLT